MSILSKARSRLPQEYLADGGMVQYRQGGGIMSPAHGRYSVTPQQAPGGIHYGQVQYQQHPWDISNFATTYEGGLPGSYTPGTIPVDEVPVVTTPTVTPTTTTPTTSTPTTTPTTTTTTDGGSSYSDIITSDEANEYLDYLYDPTFGPDTVKTDVGTFDPDFTDIPPVHTEVSDEDIAKFADFGLAGTLLNAPDGSTTFINEYSQDLNGDGVITEVEALTQSIERVSNIDRERAIERANEIADEAAATGKTIQEVALEREDSRDWNFGFTPTGTATSNTGTASGVGSTDVYDPRGVDQWGGSSTFDRGTPVSSDPGATSSTPTTSTPTISTEGSGESYTPNVGGYGDKKLTDLSSAEVDTLIDSITQMEGGNPGDRNTRNNNPGNLEATDWVKSQPGYVGTDGRFAIFDTPEAGEAALGELLVSGNTIYKDKTVGNFLETYAPQHENDTAGYTNFVEDALQDAFVDDVLANTDNYLPPTSDTPLPDTFSNWEENGYASTVDYFLVKNHGWTLDDSGKAVSTPSNTPTVDYDDPTEAPTPTSVPELEWEEWDPGRGLQAAYTEDGWVYGTPDNYFESSSDATDWWRDQNGGQTLTSAGVVSTAPTTSSTPTYTQVASDPYAEDRFTSVPSTDPITSSTEAPTSTASSDAPLSDTFSNWEDNGYASGTDYFLVKDHGWTLDGSGKAVAPPSNTLDVDYNDPTEVPSTKDSGTNLPDNKTVTTRYGEITSDELGNVSSYGNGVYSGTYRAEDGVLRLAVFNESGDIIETGLGAGNVVSAANAAKSGYTGSSGSDNETFNDWLSHTASVQSDTPGGWSVGQLTDWANNATIGSNSWTDSYGFGVGNKGGVVRANRGGGIFKQSQPMQQGSPYRGILMNKFNRRQ